MIAKRKRGGYYYPSRIYGIIVTGLALIISSPKFAEQFIQSGIDAFTDIARACMNWYDDPTGFFLSYFLGYALIWWKPLFGSGIIIFGSLLVTLVNLDNMGFIIFSLPTLMVGVLYILSWKEDR